ncbi:hypothetical protein FVEG_03396 [Fusarium verticillioides 7600]|uniref:Ig-like domain-containing protein n=1 Tax=Gibberella moniliformis (strain M3125 / FGSC 7600) TaxID=334819 RepID=W7M174_GIBM7|nr:hypothetical protein FVEG_03396 [Fusarium verticillioides 7600]EWG41254.1 hypothetical protein FVEG_03396 [Fusarium verticillioides 7600]
MINTLSLQSILFFVSACLATDVHVAWRLEHETKASALVAVDTNGTVIAETCGSIIHARDPIDFSYLDENDGSGKFFIGNATYMVHSNPLWSGGPACSRTFNRHHTLVQCSGISWDALGAIVDEPRDCFAKAPTDGELMDLQSRELDETGQMQKRGWWQKFKEHARQGAARTRLELVGDGNPRQHYYHIQISETIDCGPSSGCSVGRSDSESRTISASYNINGPEKVWGSMNFGVSKSWSTGNSYTCNGVKNETVCIWYNVAHTTYHVKSFTIPFGGYKNQEKVEEYDISSPNKKNKGGQYYCVVGNCTFNGDNWWDRVGRKGVA